MSGSLQERLRGRRWARVLAGCAVFGVLGLAAVGAVTSARHAYRRTAAFFRGRRQPVPVIPISKLPGPRRQFGPQESILDETNSTLMTGTDDPVNERWCDVAGNFYTGEFISGFSYSEPGRGGARVRVRVDPVGPTLRGRLEAHGLKPNFAYQIKLRGDFNDRAAFERIGYAGRWRLPGRGTNYTDDDYREYPRKHEVEAYMLFDFFVTDQRGNATRDFALDSCLHVLWNASRQRGRVPTRDLYLALVDAGRPDIYSRPRMRPAIELLWAERERHRYRAAAQKAFLPPGEYSAELVLTEESFHSHDNDGGYWATVLSCPVSFEVTAGAASDLPDQAL